MIMSKYISRLTVVVLATIFSSAALGQAVMSQYVEGKVFHNNGFVLEGKNIRMSMESVTFEVMGQDQVLPLSEITQVMVKKGKGKRYGKTCAIISLSLSGLSLLSSGGKIEKDDGEEEDMSIMGFTTGAIIFGGLSYGVGYGVGLINDPWQVVYLSRE